MSSIDDYLELGAEGTSKTNSQFTPFQEIIEDLENQKSQDERFEDYRVGKGSATRRAASGVPKYSKEVNKSAINSTSKGKKIFYLQQTKAKIPTPSD